MNIGKNTGILIESLLETLQKAIEKNYEFTVDN
jgi:hypothetical protein